MRRIITLLAVVAFVFATTGCKKDKNVTVERTGLVNFIGGDVLLIGKDGKEAKAAVGNEVKQGMKIKTVGKKSFADIYFGENAVKVLGDTVVEVQVLVTNVGTNGEESTFYVEKGQFFSKVGQKLAKDDKYMVKSPTTTAGVRGTDFLISEEEGKANVAVLDGSVEVLNNSLAGKEPVVVNDREEVDVLAGQDMVKKQLSEDRMRALAILLEIKAMREEIWNKMREQREEIRKAVEDQRQVNKEMLEKQREGDKALVEDQKRRDQEMIGNIKDETKAMGEAAKGLAKDQMADAKNVDKDASKDEAIRQKEAMKPTIEKMKIDKDQFKTK
ncbi:MAG: FecR domain-containing protein [Spirochaetota bacterium]|jgi:hypothetical protein